MNFADVRWIALSHIDDDRGTLTVIESSGLPFDIKRVFYIHGVPSGKHRGGHAHRSTQQILVGASGGFCLDVSDGDRTETFELDDPNRGLYLPRMTWVRLHAFRPGTVALVLCDEPYAPEHVVPDWDCYRRLVRESRVVA